MIQEMMKDLEALSEKWISEGRPKQVVIPLICGFAGGVANGANISIEEAISYMTEGFKSGQSPTH